MARRRSLTAILTLVGVAVVAATVVILSGHDHPHSDADAAAISRLPRVAGVSRACLFDPADARFRTADTATWDELQTIASRRPLLAQRTPVQPAHPSRTRLVTLLDSAVARRCDAVVVIGPGWLSALARSASRHDVNRFVMITTDRIGTSSLRSNVRVVRYVSAGEFTPSLDGALR